MQQRIRALYAKTLAAPELLEALKRAVDTIVYLDEDYDQRDSYRHAISAIAHAEGQP